MYAEDYFNLVPDVSKLNSSSPTFILDIDSAMKTIRESGDRLSTQYKSAKKELSDRLKEQAKDFGIDIEDDNRSNKVSLKYVSQSPEQQTVLDQVGLNHFRASFLLDADSQFAQSLLNRAYQDYLQLASESISFRPLARFKRTNRDAFILMRFNDGLYSDQGKFILHGSNCFNALSGLTAYAGAAIQDVDEDFLQSLGRKKSSQAINSFYGVCPFEELPKDYVANLMIRKMGEYILREARRASGN